MILSSNGKKYTRRRFNMQLKVTYYLGDFGVKEINKKLTGILTRY